MLLQKPLQRWYPPAETKIPLSSFIGALTSGKEDFAHKFCKFLGVEQCTLGSSGRALLSCLFQQLGDASCNKRKEVLIPGYTCYSVAASVARAGLKISVYDLEPSTLYPDIQEIKEQINENTLAVVVQHLFGIPSPMDEILDMARSYGSIVIEDAAQGLGGFVSGYPLGTRGDFGLYSFGRGKPLPLGGGGALISKDKAIIENIQFKYRRKDHIDFAKTALVQILSIPKFYGLLEMLPLGLGNTIFDPWFNISSMCRPLQRLGFYAMDSLGELNAHRNMVSQVYKESLAKFCISVPDDVSPVYPRFPLRIKPIRLTASLRRLGIRAMYPMAIADEPDVRPYLAKKHPVTPGATEISKSLITLPTHKRISRDLACKIVSQVNGSFCSL